MNEGPPFFAFGGDFFLLYRVGQAILAGTNPYAVYGSYYPPAMSYAFALFALLPPAASLIVWTFANAFFLVRIARGRSALAWMFCYPVAWAFVAGQVDLLFVALATFLPSKGWKSVAAAALITLKPQLAVILLAWWVWQWLRTDRKQLVRVALASAGLHAAPLVFHPELARLWLDRLASTGDSRLWLGAGLWAFTPHPTPEQVALILLAVAIIAGATLLMARTEQGIRAVLLAAMPFTMNYDASALIGGAPWWVMVPLSWVLFIIGKYVVGSYGPTALLALVVIAWQARPLVLARPARTMEAIA